MVLPYRSLQFGLRNFRDKYANRSHMGENHQGDIFMVEERRGWAEDGSLREKEWAGRELAD